MKRYYGSSLSYVWWDDPPMILRKKHLMKICRLIRLELWDDHSHNLGDLATYQVVFYPPVRSLTAVCSIHLEVGMFTPG